MRRSTRSIVWALLGAIPGVVLIVIPGFVESQGENLLLPLLGVLLVLLGVPIGAVAGFQTDPVRRRAIAGGGVGALVGVGLGGFFVKIVGPSPLVWLVAALIGLGGVVAGVAIGRRSGRSIEEPA